ncbi:MAG: hypothetical protein KGH95_07705 [Thaumarchaeota archaeon]|nr:hypothetical protein [Nitrososphaerota archaeon]
MATLFHVPDRWERFRSRIDEDVIPLKKKMVITIYGSYTPENELRFLEKQRDFLIKNGYEKTKLVKEYHEQSPSLTSYQVSKDCLLYSDVNFFIFTKEGKNQGVTVELHIAATDDAMADKVKHCIVFDQIKDNYGSISPLSIDAMDNVGIIKRDFVSEEDLQTALLQKAFLSLRMLQNILRKRQSI